MRAVFAVLAASTLVAPACADVELGLGSAPSAPPAARVRYGYPDASDRDALSAEDAAPIDSAAGPTLDAEGGESDGHVHPSADASDGADAEDLGGVDGDVDSGVGAVTFSGLYSRILFPRCGCHTSPPVLAGLDLSTEAKAYRNLLGDPPGTYWATGSACVESGRPRVVPGNPAASLLWQKVQSFDDRLRCGSQMPQASAPLSTLDVESIAEWIEAGALP